MESLVTIAIAVLLHPVGASTLGAVAKAVRDDWKAFQEFPTFAEAKRYRWEVVAWKAFRGALVGFTAGLAAWLTALGLGSAFTGA